MHVSLRRRLLVVLRIRPSKELKAETHPTNMDLTVSHKYRPRGVHNYRPRGVSFCCLIVVRILIKEYLLVANFLLYVAAAASHLAPTTWVSKFGLCYDLIDHYY